MAGSLAAQSISRPHAATIRSKIATDWNRSFAEPAWPSGSPDRCLGDAGFNDTGLGNSVPLARSTLSGGCAGQQCMSVAPSE
jgi:hypothetical protein